MDNIWGGSPRQQKYGKIGCGVALVALVFVILLFVFLPEPARPVQSADLPPAFIRDTGLNPPALNLDIDFGNARSGLVIEAAGNEIAALAAKMIRGSQPITDSVSVINFTILGGDGGDPVVGRKIAHLTLKTETMRALAREGADGGRFLNSAIDAGRWPPANADVVDGYCQANSLICERFNR